MVVNLVASIQVRYGGADLSLALALTSKPGLHPLNDEFITDMQRCQVPTTVLYGCLLRFLRWTHNNSLDNVSTVTQQKVLGKQRVTSPT